MTISIRKLHSEDTYAIYDVQFFTDNIETTVTHDPETVTNWLISTERVLSNLNHLIVGLDTEWRPHTASQKYAIAILQICVDHRCLIFQILHSNIIPVKLHEFFAKEEYSFAGVAIQNDVNRLGEDHKILVRGKLVDLGTLAAKVYEDNVLEKIALKNLVEKVLQRSMNKSKSVTMSKWDNMSLTPEQVQYACVDAFVSFEIGRHLLNQSIL